ncbi:putative saga complex component [Erysiphe neolycopersici]|uniref:Putative saga complex component n=1 Tax=Erysiphe neolycopersici TaxID=212602 RepID=A0A420HC54_9PEZI|nr:putative saga complex component [Erysiphe neolycopersici]
MASKDLTLLASNESKSKVVVKKESVEDRPFSSKIKLKISPLKHVKPGNWRDGGVVDENNNVGNESTNYSPPSSRPVVNLLDNTSRQTFPTGRPLEDPIDLIRCIICKKMILKSVSGPHVNACNALKKQKAQRKKEQKEARDRERREAEVAADDDDDYKSSNMIKKGKKRKADTEIDRVLKPKKKKDEPKPRVPKFRGEVIHLHHRSSHLIQIMNLINTNIHIFSESHNLSFKNITNIDIGPVDVERQCGVLKDGVPCARSLTCKSHSMGAKRAVAGRSLPYDFLLAAYQKKNQAKQQKAAINANAPLEDDDPTQGPIDSDDELSTVMQGLSNWNPQPAVPPVVQIPIDRKYMRERLREQLSQATNGFTVNIFKIKVVPDDRLNDDADGDWDENEIGISRKSSYTAGSRRSVGLESAI